MLEINILHKKWIFNFSSNFNILHIHLHYHVIFFLIILIILVDRKYEKILNDLLIEIENELNTYHKKNTITVHERKNGEWICQLK